MYNASIHYCDYFWYLCLFCRDFVNQENAGGAGRALWGHMDITWTQLRRGASDFVTRSLESQRASRTNVTVQSDRDLFLCFWGFLFVSQWEKNRFKHHSQKIFIKFKCVLQITSWDFFLVCLVDMKLVLFLKLLFYMIQKSNHWFLLLLWPKWVS